MLTFKHSGGVGGTRWDDGPAPSSRHRLMTSGTAVINEPVGARGQSEVLSADSTAPVCCCSALSSLPSTFSVLLRCADMAEAFVGTWNLLRSEKFDEYMKGLGK